MPIQNPGDKACQLIRTHEFQNSRPVCFSSFLKRNLHCPVFLTHPASHFLISFPLQSKHLIVMHMVHEEVLLLQGLDSFWFFSNILSPSSHVTTSIIDELSINQVQLKDSPSAPAQTTKPVSRSEQLMVKTGSYDSPRCIRGPNRKPRRKISSRVHGTRRRPRSLKEDKEVVEFMDMCSCLGVPASEARAAFTLMGHQKLMRRFGIIQNTGNPIENMPPMADGLAMKEHLKSWAYAVACTVR